MTLSKSSWHYKMHKLLYGRTAKDPKNFCPYFWKTIVLGLILITPMTLVSIPAFLGSSILRKVNPDTEPPTVREEGYFSPFIFMALAFNAGLFALYSIFAMWFVSLGKDGKPGIVHIFGGLGILLILWIVGAQLRSRWIEKRDAKRRAMYASGSYRRTIKPYEEPKPNVFIAYIKAWYKKNCPLIDWK